MKKVITCANCKHSQYMAGIDLRLSRMLNAEPHPYPTHTCAKYGITQYRYPPFGRVKRVPRCIRENGGQKRGE